MLIIALEKSNGPEVASQRALDAVPGVFLANAKIPLGGGRTREVDGIAITTTGIVVVEAKGFKKGSPSSGELQIPFNGPWEIGGQVADFHGGDLPSTQARKSAQTLAGHLRKTTRSTQFVSAAVSLTAREATMAQGPALVGDVVVSLDRDLPRALAMLRPSRVTASEVLDVIKALQVSPRLVPDLADIEAEWAKDPRTKWSGRNVKVDFSNPEPVTAPRSPKTSWNPAPYSKPVPPYRPGPPAPKVRRSATKGLFRLLVWAVLIGIVGTIGAVACDVTGGIGAGKAEAAFKTYLAEDYPKAKPNWDTVECHEGEGTDMWYCEVDEFETKKSARRLGGHVFPRDDRLFNNGTWDVPLSETDDAPGQ